MINRIKNWTLLLLLLCWLPSYGQDTIVFTADSTMADAMVANGGVETQNFGSQKNMYVFHQVGQQIPMVFRTFIEYDVSSIPENAIITEAKLSLYPLIVDNTQNHPIYIERVDGTTWTEGGVTWNNQPSVITTDQLAFSHSQTTNTVVQEFDVTDHVQIMVNQPALNNGWRIRLQSEQSTSSYGIVYNSSESNLTAKRPTLTVTYVLPIEMETEVVHCTAGNDDGTLSVDVSGGSSYSLSNMFFYKTVRDTSHRGKATLTNYKTTGNLSYNSATGEVTAEDLEPGIYILRILDDAYYTNSDLRLAFYKHILVGREGETTSGILLPNYQYQENTSIEYDKPTSTNPLDRANTNFHSNTSVIPLRVADSPNYYEKASLIKYNLDFDDQLEFSKAELQMNAWSGFFRHNNSSNAVTYSLITSDWEESQVTWNTRPTIDSLTNVTIPTTSTIGYDPTHKWDTVSIMTFVEHWLENPDENYGFEIALETYGATQLALRDYKSTGNDINYVCFEFEVKQAEINVNIDFSEEEDAINVAITGGASPFSFLWSNGETTKDLTQISSGIYWLKVTDAEDNVTKREISVEQDIIWDAMTCTAVLSDTLTRIPLCTNSDGDNIGGAISSSADEQFIGLGENGWVEYKITESVSTKIFGFGEAGAYTGNADLIKYGVVFEELDAYFIVNNVALSSERVLYNANDIFKVEKLNDHIYFFQNGVEIKHHLLGSSEEVVLHGAGVLHSNEKLEEMRFGTIEKDFEDEPCELTIALNNAGVAIAHDFVDPVEYCPEDECQIIVSGGLYYRWFPEVGLSCYDCASPTITSEVENTYVMRAYSSYEDYLSITRYCATKTITVEPKDDCLTLDCSIILEQIPNLEAYCPGDIIQFHLSGTGLDHVVWSPEAYFNCSDCLDPQFTVPASDIVIAVTLYEEEELGEEQPDWCARELIPIVVRDNCNMNEGLSFNNFGSNVWVEDNGISPTVPFLNIHCNYLNEKVMISESGEDVPTSGKVINESTIRILKNWTNNGETGVFSEVSEGIPGVGENYQNGIVELYGAHQNIQGVEPTRFYQLDLSGTDKKEMYVDAYVKKQLNLTTIELGTRDNVLFIKNGLSSSVTNTPDLGLGFVSSNLEGGYVSWDIGFTGGIYEIPLGSSIDGIRFKPLEIELIYGGSMSLKSRLVNYNPIYNGLIEQAPDIEIISDEYFYYVLPDGEEDKIGELKFHYNSISDGDFQHIAHWDNVWAVEEFGEARWQKTTDIELLTDPSDDINDKRISTGNWPYYNSKEFVLARAGFVIDFDDFGDGGDGEDGDVIVDVVVISGGGEGGGLDTEYETGGDTDGGDVFTPTPMPGTYQINVDQIDCGIDGIIQFEVDVSGNITPLSVYYILDGLDPLPLAEELYNLVPTGDGGAGILQLFSIPESKYKCENNIAVNLSEGMTLLDDEELEIITPDGIDVTEITVYDSDGILIEEVLDTNTWDPSGSSEGVYKLEFTVDDGETLTQIKAIFIIKS